ncbi:MULTISPECIES: ABC transporter substrate-binding protein [unclassified Cupriavidus]|uniref:ABC transporter substrate-binding protein n=1 Tax=unclassified Cupriavidus TaxID=2640874 RepID=UPI001AE1F3BF|nr:MULTISPECIES: ABC transporter substrate-binding protein [unclassified Cupriavidus]MBP0633567.1 ABC transporter substrate-binding protein [Cupriavidus sp. AcVe19-1a]MBP0640056.1 ABC transporter substrate-binding protein [Cupriavidus sp. AcVe19-6a]
MNRREMLRAGAYAGLVKMTHSTHAFERRPHVVFLNPGESAERGTGQHWQLVSSFMGMAAMTFNMQLEVLYAERDHLLMQRQAEEVARRSFPPDYVIIVNEKMAAQQMLKVLAHSPSKILIIHNDLTSEQRQYVGNEREKISNWIGTLTANAELGGFRLMEFLYQRLGRREVNVIGITGDPNTPVSLERAAGVAAFLNQTANGRICQLVFSDWSRADSHQKARVLLARYPEANVMWAANDTMALGALDAVKLNNAHVLVGGMGALKEALESVIDGGLAGIVAGDYFVGAWAMVLLYDYHWGKDFAKHGGPRLKLDYLGIIERTNARRFADVVFRRIEAFDVRPYSKHLNQREGSYDFDLKHLLKTTTRSL